MIYFTTKFMSTQQCTFYKVSFNLFEQIHRNHCIIFEFNTELVVCLYLSKCASKATRLHFEHHVTVM